MADSERVSSETFETVARWVVVVSFANRIRSTNSGAGVLAFILDASFVAVAVIVCHAFGFAADVWVTEIFGQTTTGTNTISFFANCVRAARRGVAWLRDFLDRRSYRGFEKVIEKIYGK